MVEVESIEDGGYYSDGNVSGSTVNVTLCRPLLDAAGKDTGKLEYVYCPQILIFEEDDEDALEDTFDEWKECAEAGEEGYKYWVE